MFGTQMQVRTGEPFTLASTWRPLPASARRTHQRRKRCRRPLISRHPAQDSRRFHAHDHHPGWYALDVEDQQGRKAYTDPVWVTIAPAAVVMRGAPRRSLRYGQLRTILLLFGGLCCLLLLPADLSVATPLLVEELGKQGLSHSEAIVRIGSIWVPHALANYSDTGGRRLPCRGRRRPVVPAVENSCIA